MRGDLDALLAPEVGRTVLAEHEPHAEAVRLDLSKVSFCDSSGLRVIFRLNQALDGPGCRFVICDPAPSVRRVLEIVDQSHTIAVEPGAFWPT